MPIFGHKHHNLVLHKYSVSTEGAYISTVYFWKSITIQKYADYLKKNGFDYSKSIWLVQNVSIYKCWKVYKYFRSLNLSIIHAYYGK